jgi:hypothetical protein
MTTQRQFLLYVATALAAVGVFAGDVAQAGKPPALKLTMTVSPSTIIEGSTATGKVTHNNSSLTSPVTVTLSSSDTSEATVAATGYASGSTNVTVADAPTFQYVLTIPDLPADSTGGVYVNDMNNRGQVVGWYAVGEGRKGYLYDPAIPGGVIDLSALNLPGIPPGYQINSVVGINDHQVLVGYLTNDFGLSGDSIGFAIDWAADTPVVDLLPEMGSGYSYGRKINENGDILGVFEDTGGAIRAYFHNPGVYGDPGLRAPRDGSALNWSAVAPDEVLLFVTGGECRRSYAAGPK